MRDRQRTISLNIKASATTINETVHNATKGITIHPELETPENIRAPEVYKRFQNLEAKEKFRHELLSQLNQSWTEQFGIEDALQLKNQFSALAQTMDDTGALIIGDLIDKSEFSKLVKHYDKMLAEFGSKSWIHSYINLANHPDFLSNQEFSDAFLHPLLIALISFRIGGAIRIVDGRGKNAEPISVLAQDNMLHIDNTPFNDEYKILVKWEKGKASGPNGQNFVFLPGTHKGARNCLKDSANKVWSSENASIFITEENVEKLFKMQKKLLGSENPVVVEAHHASKPLSTAFSAGSLVHHRYRTLKGCSRSCVIIAFQRAGDNPGQFMAPEHVEKFSKKGDVTSYLFGYQCKETESNFINALVEQSRKIAGKLFELKDEACSAEIVPQQVKELSKSEMEQWMELSTSAPTVENVKMTAGDYLQLGVTLPEKEFCSLLVKMMMYDKHGPLDLILYSDNHEEIRKWARNRIREMRIDRLVERLKLRVSDVEQPGMDKLLTPQQLKDTSNKLINLLDAIPTEIMNKINLDKDETISGTDAYRSLRQLINDLGESVMRCVSRQGFLSTSLFLFWTCDELSKFQGGQSAELQQIGQKLLNHYLSMAIVITLKFALDKNLCTSVKALYNGEFGLFTDYYKASIIENRHQDASSQHEYDKQFGLIISN